MSGSGVLLQSVMVHDRERNRDSHVREWERWSRRRSIEERDEDR